MAYRYHWHRSSSVLSVRLVPSIEIWQTMFDLSVLLRGEPHDVHEQPLHASWAPRNYTDQKVLHLPLYLQTSWAVPIQAFHQNRRLAVQAHCIRANDGTVDRNGILLRARQSYSACHRIPVCGYEPSQYQSVDGQTGGYQHSINHKVVTRTSPTLPAPYRRPHPKQYQMR